MKISISTRQLFVLGFVLLLATNIIVLAGVAYNRSGEADTRITLTERELRSPYYTRAENSGLALNVVWRILNNHTGDQYLFYSRPMVLSSYGDNVEWLDRNKMEALGFDTEAMLRNNDDLRRRKVTVPREVYLVLEYDGAAYREAVTRAQAAVAKEQKSLASKPDDKDLQKRLHNAERWLAFEHIEAPRLFAVDAGLDPDQLRQQYSDRSHYIIAKGLVTAGYYVQKPEVIGRIKRISIDSIHVPLQFRKFFDGAKVLRTMRADNPPIPPRYAVDLAYGSRLEPWIEAVRKLQQKEQPAKSAK